MAYSPTPWQSGAVITSTGLNKIENQLGSINCTNDDLTKITQTQANNALEGIIIKSTDTPVKYYRATIATTGETLGWVFTEVQIQSSNS